LREVNPASKTLPKADPLPYERMERTEVRARIDNAITQLSPEHRAVILMKETEGMQSRDRGNTWCSIGTVMSRLFYARKKLQNLLKVFMKTFEEKWTAWLDDQLTGKELEDFEASLPDKEAAETENATRQNSARFSSRARRTAIQ